MNEVAIHEQQAVAQHAPTPAHMLQTAIEKGLPMEQLEKLMDLEERYRANEAKKAFDAAVAAFHEDPPRVLKDKLNTQYGSMYTSLGNLVTTVGEALGKHGLSCRFKFNQTPESIEVTCIMSHALGHCESVTIAAGPDTSGAKNPIQQVRSTLTYLRGITFEAVTGIASEEGMGVNKDDDGRAAATQLITDEQAYELKQLIRETESDTKRFLKAMGNAPSVDELPASRYNQALLQLRKKMAKMNKEKANAE